MIYSARCPDSTMSKINFILWRKYFWKLILFVLEYVVKNGEKLRRNVKNDFSFFFFFFVWENMWLKMNSPPFFFLPSHKHLFLKCNLLNQLFHPSSLLDFPLGKLIGRKLEALIVKATAWQHRSCILRALYFDHIKINLLDPEINYIGRPRK